MLLFLLSGCAKYFALRFAPERLPEVSEAPDAVAAKAAFWDAFEGDRIDDLPQVVETLNAAYLGHPQDPSLARLLGHAHFWWFVERGRMTDTLPASATEHAVLAEHYFSEAALLDPDDRRLHSWWGGALLIVGGLRGDQRVQRQGFFETKEGVDKHPAYNLVTSSFSFSIPPRNSRAFPQAVEVIWDAVDQCAGTDLDRTAFDPGPIVDRNPLPDRDDAETCWNKERFYPYNQQGIFLQLGDILMKDEQPEVARTVYESIRDTPDYDTWPLAEMLDDRLENHDRYTADWVAFNSGASKEQPPLLATSGRSCTVCHVGRAPSAPSEP